MATMLGGTTNKLRFRHEAAGSGRSAEARIVATSFNQGAASQNDGFRWSLALV
jgi:hypothetical protein